MGEAFPGALVVGLDVVPSKPDRPSNYAFVRGNVLQGLPFARGQFDFVHQKLMVAAVPLKHWPAVVTELVRVARPGGWIELLESAPHLKPEGPATKRLWDLLRQLGRTVGHDTLGTVPESLDRYLKNAGAAEVQTRTVVLPVGEWGDQVGVWMLCEFRSLFTRLTETFSKRHGLSPDECGELIAGMLAEFEQLRPTISFRVAIGRRTDQSDHDPPSTTESKPWRA
jgi:SAM-dependent methyltransferase